MLRHLDLDTTQSRLLPVHFRHQAGTPRRGVDADGGGPLASLVAYIIAPVMTQRIEELSTDELPPSGQEAAWRLVLAAARAADAAERFARRSVYSLDAAGELVRAPVSGDAALIWEPDRGWIQPEPSEHGA